MPALGSISDAFCLSEDDSKHSLNLFHAALQLEVCQDMLDKIENDNFHIHGVARGREGDAGNFSGVVRRSVRQLVDGFTGYVAFLSELGVPTRCFDAMCTRAAMTLMNENFFTEMRRRWPNPYSGQYAQSHAVAVNVEAMRSGAGSDGFIFFTGASSGKAKHYGFIQRLAPRPRHALSSWQSPPRTSERLNALAPRRVKTCCRCCVRSLPCGSRCVNSA